MPRRHGWLALALLAPLLGACGGNSGSSTDEVRKPELTVPQDASGPASPADTTDTTPTDTTDTTGTTTGSPDAPLDQPNPGNGGVPAPDSNTPPPTGQDSPAHDTPPRRGSPADRFEQFCAQNPGAC